MGRILLLMPSTTYHAADFMEAARRLGVDVVVGTDQRQALDATRDRVLPLDFRDPAGAARQVAAFDAQHPLDAIVPTDDETAVLAAHAAVEVGLTANPIDAARAANDKLLLRRVLADARLPTPQFRVLPVTLNPEAVAAELSYPCVLKPTFLSASRGVIRADDADGFVVAFRRVAALLARPEVADRGGPAAGQLLVESFVPGREFALEGLLRDGRLQVLALFDKPDPLDGPFFEESLYVTPSRLPDPDQQRIAATVGEAAAALGLVDGPVHAEVRLGESDPVVIDLAARMIGGLCSRALRFGTGMSLEEVILLHALGRQVEPAAVQAGASAVLMLPIPRGGTLRAVEGLDEVRGIPGIRQVEITIPVGQAVVPLPEGDRYLGFVFAQADLPQEAESLLRRAASRLQFRID